MIRLRPEIVSHNRQFFLQALRSGKFKKGTIRSDEKGRPVVEFDGDEGYCACALMSDLFLITDGVRSNRNYLRALNLTTEQCRYIQQDLNDSPLTFAEIADRIEREIFNDA
jgi:hypothetical protein